MNNDPAAEALVVGHRQLKIDRIHSIPKFLNPLIPKSDSCPIFIFTTIPVINQYPLLTVELYLFMVLKIKDPN